MDFSLLNIDKNTLKIDYASHAFRDYTKNQNLYYNKKEIYILIFRLYLLLKHYKFI